MKRDHVYLYITDEEGQRKFFCFFIDRATAEKWTAKQDDPAKYEISDVPPERKVQTAVQSTEEAAPADAVAATTDKGMEKALAAVKEAKGA